MPWQTPFGRRRLFLIGSAVFTAASLFAGLAVQDSPTVDLSLFRMPWILVLIVVGPLTGKLAERLTPRLLVAGGVAVMAAGLALLAGG